MTNTTLNIKYSNGDTSVLVLRGWRGALVSRLGPRLPQWAMVALASAMGASVVPTGQYSDPDEAVAYYQGYDAGFHDEPMVASHWPQAYTRGYWEGKR